MTIAELKALKKRLQMPLPLLQQVDEWECDDQEQDDLNDLVGIRSRGYSYFYAPDDSMSYLGLKMGDIVVVDHRQAARHGSLVVAQVEDSFVCRELNIRAQQLTGQCLDPIDMDEYACCRVLGVVSATIRQF